MAEEELIKKTVPHNLEAEQAVLGAMLVDNSCIDQITEIVCSEDFYSKQNGLVFECISELYKEKKVVDVLTVADRLKEKGAPEEMQSAEFIRNILMSVPSSSGVKAYAGIVYEKSTLRKLIHVSENTSADCYMGNKPLNDILEETEKSVFQLANARSNAEYTPIDKVVTNVLKNIDEASKSKNNITGLATGFEELDLKLSGLQNSDFVLIAARPSMGKTAFALSIADYVSIKKKIPVAIFSLEMSNEQLANRLLSMEGKIDASKLRTGSLTEEEWEKLMYASESVGTSGIIIDDIPGASVADIRSRSRKYKNDKQIGLIIIDYLQLMTAGSGSKSDNRQQELSEISRGLKSLARELNIPVIALSQLNRAVETRPDHRPMMADIRESGAIEQDADVIMFLYRDEVYNPDTEDKSIAEVIIAKQRNGPIGTVKLVWQPMFTRFVNRAKEGPVQPYM